MNPFDQFDERVASNPFDQFDQMAPQQNQATTPVQSNQVAPPIDLKGAIQDRLRQKQQWSDLPGNIPSSAAKFGSDIWQAVSHPIDTAKAVGNLALGAIDKAAASLEENTPPEIRDAVTAAGNWVAENTGLLAETPEGGVTQMPTYQGEIAEKVGQFYVDRYGSLENAKNTIISDPVGVAADLSMVLTGGAGLAKQAPGMAKTAEAMGKIGRAINPLAPVAKTARAAGRGVKNAASSALGMTSGSGAEAVKAGLRPTKNYLQAMRGRMSDEDVLRLARQSLNTLKEKRSDAYTKTLGDIKNSTKVIDIKPIKNLSETWLKRFNVRKTPEGLDFSRSTLTGPAAKEVDEIYSMIKSWGSDPSDLTPAGMDILKRRIGDFYTEGRNSRAMATSLENAVKGKIVSQVPEYAKMTKEYSKASEAIKAVEQALLGKGGKASADTALRKLAMAAREEKGFRRSLIDMMDEATGADVKGAVMGRAMNPAWSNRLGPMISATGIGIAGVNNPALLMLLPAASPRAVGEFMSALGVSADKARKIAKMIPKSPISPPLVASEVGGLPIFDGSGIDNQNK